MSIYLFIFFPGFFVLWIILFCSNISLSEKHKVILETLIIIIPLFLLMAFRGNSVGTDTNNYLKIYINAAQMNLLQNPLFKHAPVYILYNKILSFVFPFPQAILCFNAAIIVFGMAYCIYSNSKSRLDSWYIYFVLSYYFYAFNMMRQVVAMTFILISWTFLKKENKKMAIIFLAMAIGIHSTAIIGALLILVLSIKMNYKRFGTIVIITLVVENLFEVLVHAFVRIFPSYSGYLLGNELYARDGKTNGIYLGIFMLFYVLLDLVNGVHNKRERVKNENLNGICVICIYIITVIVMRNSNVAARAILYFSQYIIFYIPEMLERQNVGKNQQIIRIVSYPLMLIPFYISVQNYVPYIPFWE